MHDADLPSEQFLRHGQHAIEWAARYLEGIRDRPVLPSLRPGDVARSLPASGPEQGEPMEAILADFERLIVPATTQWNHPGFHAYFSVSASGPGILAELLASTLNVNHMLWKSGPAPTELEQVSLDWLRQWMGLPDGLFGIIHDTASVAVLHAIAAAREAADPAARTEGATPGLVVYASEQAHSSVEKGAIALGFGQRHVRKVPVDDAYRMRPDALRDAILADRDAGLRPCCVVATVGTTATTSVDPVPAVADLAEEHGLWLHVDAAYGGALGVVPEQRHLLDGCGRADSLVVNPHKWLFVPIDCSVLYTRRPGILRRAFSLVPDYLHTAEPALNLMDYGVPLGRRFRSLKLWFVMRYFGREGVVAILRRHVAWAQELARRLNAHPDFEVVAPVPMSTVCFRHRAGDEATQRLVDRINAGGGAFLMPTRLRGQLIVRCAIGNVRTTAEDVERVWSLLTAERTLSA